jgi:hypothetical protein
MIHNSRQRGTKGAPEFHENFESCTRDFLIGITVQLTLGAATWP